MEELNVASLLVQGGYALKRGDKARAAVLLGTATIASRHRQFSYAVQGALAANDVRKELGLGP